MFIHAHDALTSSIVSSSAGLEYLDDVASRQSIGDVPPNLLILISDVCFLLIF
jgi:hypothetical protein